jgi:putative ABC transport system substrate-binding protein
MMNRRRRVVFGCVLLGLGSLPAGAADARRRHVGVLSARKRPAVIADDHFWGQFIHRLRELGYDEGRNLTLNWKFGDDVFDRLLPLAHELVAAGVDVIVTAGTGGLRAAKAATSTIPIVFATASDPVGNGLVQSLARPGGNVTGICSVMDSLAPKCLELLLQLFPGLQRVGLLGERQDARLRLDRDALAPLLSARGMRLMLAEATNPQGVDAAVDRLLSERAEVVLTNSSLTYNLRDRLAERFRAHRVALVGHRAEMVEAGALFSYGASLPDQLRASAQVVDRVLRGAPTADIPVEQPTRFELVLNLTTAVALGVEIPPTVRLRAERIIA